MRIGYSLFLASVFLSLLINQNAHADLREVQSKYSGIVINGVTFNDSKIKQIYSGLAKKHPFELFDKVMRQTTKRQLLQVLKIQVMF